ncbi:HlyD family efflux transporter periplasmic adaptor subunit [Marinomonas mediterranea]|uniref:efflux RND transporter periplasmic adaptor subunit n=1 Tax=Marinomonas mediterranea TaxID=119864 RepID=UPI00234B0651|nr:HlyD family efflux transporter periplasmic adaptor subunit [Marinomonas mediterranea]WCN15250.1 HlyD family efflux transporter periplasmic adaptor subunit [Marinomonas mediterranea]
MKKWNFRSKRNLPIAVICGVIAVATVFKLKPDMEHVELAGRGQDAQYIPLQSFSVRPEITGFGRIQPNIKFSSLAEVSGKVVYFHPKLEKGELLPEGVVLLKIDDSTYQLQVAQGEAEVAAAEINLAEKKIALSNNLKDLELSRKKLVLAESEYRRIQGLYKSKHVSPSTLDQAKQNLLSQQQALQQYQNKKTLLPMEVKALEAQLDVAQTNLSKSKLDLENTVVTMPFMGRIHSVSVEEGQWVSVGASLFNASDIRKVQINGQFPLAQFKQFTGLLSSEFSLSQLNEQGMQTFIDELNLSAQVSLLGDENVIWKADVERFSDEIDPQTQTVGVILSVSESYRTIDMGNRPPLLTGMRAKVDLFGKAQPFVVIPRHLVHNSDILVADGEMALSRIHLTAPLAQNNVVLTQNFSLVNQKLITSDLFPAIEGSKVQIRLDQVMNDQLQTWLGGGK